jgi:glycosyltransferase involved in cell wall biosynthesis
MQMTDWLEPGGKERVAVNVANLLPRDRFDSFLCTTRRSSGALEAVVASDVVRLRLERERTFDWKAVHRLVAFNAAERIDVLHAHGSSVFMASLASMFPPHPKVVWHDHYGRYQWDERPAWLYRVAARRVGGVIVVTRPLLEWSQQRLRMPADRTWYVPNFVCEVAAAETPSVVPGVEGRRIACVAHLRPQKDHQTLLAAFAQVVHAVPDAHLLIIGGHTKEEEQYAGQLRRTIASAGLEHSVTMCGQRNDVPALLAQCDIGVLSSASEGFPLALVEYGLAGLATVATRVGECAEVLDDGRAGMLVPAGQADPLARALAQLLRRPGQRQALGSALRNRVRALYRSGPLVERICAIYEAVAGAREPVASID